MDESDFNMLDYAPDGSFVGANSDYYNLSDNALIDAINQMGSSDLLAALGQQGLGSPDFGNVLAGLTTDGVPYDFSGGYSGLGVDDALAMYDINQMGAEDLANALAANQGSGDASRAASNASGLGGSKLTGALGLLKSLGGQRGAVTQLATLAKALQGATRKSGSNQIDFLKNFNAARAAADPSKLASVTPTRFAPGVVPMQTQAPQGGLRGVGTVGGRPMPYTGGR